MITAENEKRCTPETLVRKHYPDARRNDMLVTALAVTAVIRIDVEAVTAKDNPGSANARQRALQTHTDGRDLPITLCGDSQ